MKRITVASVNKMLKELGHSERLVRDYENSYLYFSGGESHTWKQAGVYVSSAADLTLEAWLEEYNSLKSQK